MAECVTLRKPTLKKKIIILKPIHKKYNIFAKE
jgi:hypothetical protein